MPNLIGTAPNQVPVNGLLGTMAFQDSNAVTISSGTIGGVPVSSLAASVLQGEQLDTIASSSSLVLRGGATNLFTYSEQFDNAAWTKASVTVTPNSIIAPDGLLTADTLIESATNAQHSVYTQSTVTGTKTFTVYAKQANGTRLLRMVDFNATNGSQGETYFNLSSGVVSSGTGTISAAGNGWYRCSITTTTTVTSTYYIAIASSVGTFSYLGEGISGIYIWGAQLEAASTVGAYLKTEATAVSTAYAAPIESPNGIAVPLIASMTPARNGDMTFQLTSNTSLTIKVKGSDGTVRSVALTLA